MSRSSKKLWGSSSRAMRRKVRNQLQEDAELWISSQSSSLPEKKDLSDDMEEPFQDICSVTDGFMDFDNEAMDSPASNLHMVDKSLDNDSLSSTLDMNFINESLSSPSADDNENEEWFDALGFEIVRFDCDSCIDCECLNCEVCFHDENGNCVHCDNCLSDFDSVGDESESCGEDVEANSEDEGYVFPLDVNKQILSDFINLVLSENLNHTQISALMLFFRKWNFGSFPKCAKTILNTPVSLELKEVSPGLYWHRGLEKDLELYITETNCDEVRISFGVDGLPIARSSGSCFWPILCSFNKSPNVVMVGAYHGPEKPADSNVYLQEFVRELARFCNEGFTINGRVVPVFLSCAVCDAPAKSFILNVKGHNAYHGCSKCTQKGKMYGRRMAYPKVDAPLRTDESFLNHEQEEYHKGDTLLTEVNGFGPVSCVGLDYLHLVLLGVLRKIMYMWIGGPLKNRLSAKLIEKISDLMTSLTAWTPCEFARRPRSLKFIKRFKATEYRQILLYIGMLVLKDIIRDELYEHFLCLHAALYILAHPKYCHDYLSFADDLLKFWVQKFKNLYGTEFVSHNVHGLVHLASDVKKYGCVDNFSAFKFENFLQTLKKMVRKGNQPLQQLVKRYTESEQRGLFKRKPENEQNRNEPNFQRCHSRGPLKPNTTGPQYSVCKLPSGTTIKVTSQADNCCKLVDNSVIVVQNFAYSSSLKCMVVIGKKFKGCESFYSYPFDSSLIGISYVYNLERNMQCWPITSVSMIYYLVDFDDGAQIVPENWLTDDRKSCAWPPWAQDLTQLQWDKAVRSGLDPQSDWSEVAVLRQRVKGSNFPYVRGKLRDAEALSETDLQSGSDNLHGSRRLRRRKNQNGTSSESDDDQPLPIIKRYKASKSPQKPKETVLLPSFPVKSSTDVQTTSDSDEQLLANCGQGEPSNTKLNGKTSPEPSTSTKSDQHSQFPDGNRFFTPPSKTSCIGSLTKNSTAGHSGDQFLANCGRGKPSNTKLNGKTSPGPSTSTNSDQHSQFPDGNRFFTPPSKTSCIGSLTKNSTAGHSGDQFSANCGQGKPSNTKLNGKTSPGPSTSTNSDQHSQFPDGNRFFTPPSKTSCIGSLTKNSTAGHSGDQFSANCGQGKPSNTKLNGKTSPGPSTSTNSDQHSQFPDGNRFFTPPSKTSCIGSLTKNSTAAHSGDQFSANCGQGKPSNTKLNGKTSPGPSTSTNSDQHSQFPDGNRFFTPTSKTSCIGSLTKNSTAAHSGDQFITNKGRTSSAHHKSNTSPRHSIKDKSCMNFSTNVNAVSSSLVRRHLSASHSNVPSNDKSVNHSATVDSLKDRSLAMAASMTDIEFRAYVISALSQLKLRVNTPVQQPRQSKQHHDSDDMTLEAMSGLPADTLQEWKNFDEKLASGGLKSSFATSVMSALEILKQTEVQSTIRAILSRVLSNRVAQLFSLLGKGQKLSFSETYFYRNILPRVVNSGHGQTMESDVKEVTTNWLRLAAQRQGGLRFEKERQSKTEKSSSERSTPKKYRKDTYSGGPARHSKDTEELNRNKCGEGSKRLQKGQEGLRKSKSKPSKKQRVTSSDSESDVDDDVLSIGSCSSNNGFSRDEATGSEGDLLS